MHFAIHAQQPR